MGEESLTKFDSGSLLYSIQYGERNTVRIDHRDLHLNVHHHKVLDHIFEMNYKSRNNYLQFVETIVNMKRNFPFYVSKQCKLLVLNDLTKKDKIIINHANVESHSILEKDIVRLIFNNKEAINLNICPLNYKKQVKKLVIIEKELEKQNV